MALQKISPARLNRGPAQTMFSVFKNINCYAGKWKCLDEVAVFCAVFLPYVLSVSGIAYAFAINNFGILFYPLLSGIFARFAINSTIYYFLKRKRPACISGTRVLIPVPKNPSFPSSHTAFFFAISFELLFFNVQTALIFLACSCLIGIARVFAGVHWFRDILGGVASGAASAALIYYLHFALKII